MIDRIIFKLPATKRIMVLLVILFAAQALCVAGEAWSLAYVVVNLWKGFVLIDQTGWMAAFLLCFIARQAIVCFQDSCLHRFARKRADELRQSLLVRIFKKGGAIVQSQGSGSVSALVLEGIDQVETYIRLMVPKAVGVVVIPLVLLIWMIPLDWVSALIAFIAFPFIILYMVILGHTAQDEAAKQHRTFEILSNTFIDALRGIDTLKLFGRGKSYGSSIYAASERFREATMKTLRVAMLSSSVLDLFATGALAAVSIMLGFRLVDGSLAFFPALAVLVVVPEYFRPVREFASDYHASLDGKNALTAILNLIEEQPVASSVSYKEQSLQSWNEDSILRAHHIGYAYPEYHALTDISFEASGYSHIGIVGMSGAGKSTLINILGGFANPDAGNFSLEGISFPSLDASVWQRQLIYIPQTPYIFHATLRENLAFYRPCASDTDIDRAVSTMGLEDLVDELPQGLETIIGEGARALSGGQAQRIALARAFLDEDRRILLFDEPTAHLDIETEWELKARMLPLMQNHLVFFATHRLHWMNTMDQILVIEGGRLVEAGSPAALKTRQGPYARLAAQLGSELS